ncbi:MAG: hypothetical protein K5666_03705 [Bacilli bacterium]|nr:hypothetical protein [Bacilli bacterium]
MGIFDKVKRILFDDEDIEELPVRTEKKEEKEKDTEEVEKENRNLFEEIERENSGVVIHNDVDEDTITEVKVPVEKDESFIFPVKVDDDDDIFETKKDEPTLDTQQLRLKEDDFDRTKEIERVREQNLTRSKKDYIKEYTESRRLQKEQTEAKRDLSSVPEKKEKAPYKVPPVISPVFGILDKNYDPDTYEETKQQITMTNSGNSTKMTERQFGPVSFNDQGIPEPKIKSKTVIITTTVNSSDTIKEELKKEKELAKESNKIEEEILNNIINDVIETHDSIEDAFEDTNKIEPVKEHIIEEDVKEPEIEFETPKIKEEKEEPIEELYEEDNDEVITGSPYDDMFSDEEEETKELKPTVDIDKLIESTDEMEEADITPASPKNIEDNDKLDDTIETDLYNLIDSMYKDDE